MTAVLNNFVAITAQRRDVMDPASFRSAVAMIQGILSSNDYSAFNAWYQKFIAHLVDYNDPHHTEDTDFYPEIIQELYTIYTQMTSTPDSFPTFQTKEALGLNVLELMRRAVLNRYLYNQVKTTLGSVPATASVILSSEYGARNLSQSTTSLSFGSALASESVFRAVGYRPTNPVIQIANATSFDLFVPGVHPLFSTSVTTPHFSLDDHGSGYTVPFALISNDVSVRLETVGQPNVPTSVVTLHNGSDTISLFRNADTGFSLQVNGAIVIASIPSDDQRVIVEMTRSESITVTTTVQGQVVSFPVSPMLTSPSTMTSLSLDIGLENPFATTFGIRSVAVYPGSYLNSNLCDLVIFPGFDFITDSDTGAYLTDANGRFIISDDTVDVSTLPAGFSVLTDPDGTPLIDADGSFLIDPDVDPSTVPLGFIFLRDADGAYLQDSDGAFLIDVDLDPADIPPGFAILQDDDGAYLQDANGVFLIDVDVDPSTIPTGFAFVQDPDGAYLQDTDGSFLVDVDIDPSQVPDGVIFLKDADGSYLKDADGAFLLDVDVDASTIPPGFTFLRDADGAYLQDADGEFLIDPDVDAETIPSGMALLQDEDEAYLQDPDGSFLIG